MLICILYQHFTDRKDEEFDFDECSQLKTTIEKNRKKEEYFKTSVLVPKTNSMRKEEGATVAATPYLLSAGRFVRPDGRRFPWKHSTLQESPIKYDKCPTNETPAIFRHSD